MTDGEFDFVTEYVNFMSGITDAPKPFIEASALFLISTFCGRRFVFMSLPEAKVFGSELADTTMSGRLLNLWFILIGKSRVSRKSTVIGKVEEMIEEIDSELLLPADFTPEAVIRVMSQKFRNGETRCVWIHDEVSGFFEQLRKADYMVRTDTLLSRIYDGRSYTRTTIGRGNEQVINPYLTCFLASTEYLPTLFDESRIRQGFLNRFIYVVGQREKRLPLRTALTIEEEKKARMLTAWLKTLNDRDFVTALSFDKDARDLYEDFEARVENDIITRDLDLREGYYGNLPNLVIRLSGVFRISRMDEYTLATYARPILVVEREDIERAIKYTMRAWDWFNQVITMMQTSAISRPVMTEENKLEMIFKIIKRHGGEVDRTTLYRESKLLSQELEEVINTLINQGRIIREILQTRGRPRIIYKIVDGEES